LIPQVGSQRPTATRELALFEEGVIPVSVTVSGVLSPAWVNLLLMTTVPLCMPNCCQVAPAWCIYPSSEVDAESLAL
jgi:hypothetical protein